jgi:prepilin-type N-terminal cleavage/methylation domain-containing protein
LKNRGFTLIELLVVIGIILILIGIALPNFIGARMRSLVVSQKASLVASATAIESYRLDHSALPPSRYYCFAVVPELIARYYELPMELTTPTPYLARRPIDHFHFKGATNTEGAQVVKYRGIGPGLFNDLPTVEGMWLPTEFPVDNRKYVFYHESSKEHPESQCPVKYGVWSVGLDHDPLKLSEHTRDPSATHRWYSPTNGTHSLGLIARLASGHYSP